MTPIQIMEAEHRRIETVVKSLGDMAAAIEQGQRVDVSLLEGVVEFMRVYADKLHHGKEEALFFPLLVKRGVPAGGCPIGGLTHEHENGRALVRLLADQAEAYGLVKPGAEGRLLEALRGLVDLYQNHIWKEDAMVFPMADKLLTPADQEELGGKFAEVDRSVGLDVIARLEQFTARLPAHITPAGTAGVASSAGCGCGCSS